MYGDDLMRQIESDRLRKGNLRDGFRGGAGAQAQIPDRVMGRDLTVSDRALRRGADPAHAALRPPALEATAQMGEAQLSKQCVLALTVGGRRPGLGLAGRMCAPQIVAAPTRAAPRGIRPTSPVPRAGRATPTLHLPLLLPDPLSRYCSRANRCHPSDFHLPRPTLGIPGASTAPTTRK